ncbi:Haloacid dehalogenase-like hydrolase-domain-containing protein [Mycena maculata]|uniref:Haloacid dehalogenase-like hydrolase-domain-containing protein n=1 Tax=Mycena maculata TaxID=230809 RepID=A0AAD7MIP8_9AGAR|nr:Haloacid dehalogenase-like hydrolase-domain-containing protein [Mycena maculata]
MLSRLATNITRCRAPLHLREQPAWVWARYLQRDAVRLTDHPKPPLAFVFDIDGVLIRGEDVLPPARRALAMLEEMKLPYILLTNGGGVSEQARCKKLTAQLGFEIHPNQYIQAHTIRAFQSWPYILVT